MHRLMRSRRMLLRLAAVSSSQRICCPSSPCLSPASQKRCIFGLLRESVPSLAGGVFAMLITSATARNWGLRAAILAGLAMLASLGCGNGPKTEVAPTTSKATAAAGKGKAGDDEILRQIDD